MLSDIVLAGSQVHFIAGEDTISAGKISLKRRPQGERTQLLLLIA
jgi:hypothetical protein